MMNSGDSNQPRAPGASPPALLLCEALTFHLGQRRVLRSPGDDGPRGTFDFKWFPGDRIRIAVLDSGEDRLHLQYARDLLQRCAARWLERGSARVNLQVEVLQDYAPQNGSAPLPYDVLASCPSRAGGATPDGAVDSGRTQLGSYARRQDYVVPTLHLPLEGPAHGWHVGGALTDADLVAGMHEMGHVLGMPHAHQSPLLGLDGSWQPATSSVYVQWLARLGITLTPAELERFIDCELRSVHWGQVENSNWWPFGPHEFVDSIMTYPFLEECLQGQPGPAIFGPLMPSGQVAGISPPELEYWTSPTEADYRLLVEMYGRGDGGATRAAAGLRR